MLHISPSIFCVWLERPSPGSAVDVFFQVYCDKAGDVWFLHRTRRKELSTDLRLQNIFIHLWIGGWFYVFSLNFRHRMYLCMCFNVDIYFKMLFMIRFVCSLMVGRERCSWGYGDVSFLRHAIPSHRIGVWFLVIYFLRMHPGIKGLVLGLVS